MSDKIDEVRELLISRVEELAEVVHLAAQRIKELEGRVSQLEAKGTSK